MSRSVESSIEIEAPAALVWSVLMDFHEYDQWNPWILALEGATIPGQRLRAAIRVWGSLRLAIAPLVLAVFGGRELRWHWGLQFTNLFDTECVFRLETIGPSRVQLSHSVVATGLVARLGARILQARLHEMYLAIKPHAEMLVFRSPVASPVNHLAPTVIVHDPGTGHISGHLRYSTT